MVMRVQGGPAGKFGRGLVYGGLEKTLETGTFLHRDTVKKLLTEPYKR
jgi:hypothetical protein